MSQAKVAERQDSAAINGSAFRLGYSVEILDAWLSTVGWFELRERHDLRGWDWDYAGSVFGNTITGTPLAITEAVTKSLRVLALGRVVDPAVLVEVHRENDELRSNAFVMAHRIENREEIGEDYLTVQDRVLEFRSLIAALIVGQNSTLISWHDLGGALGEALKLHVARWDCLEYEEELRANKEHILSVGQASCYNLRCAQLLTLTTHSSSIQMCPIRLTPRGIQWRQS